MATEGGYARGNGDLTRLSIDRNGRTTFNLHAQGNGMLTEAERNIILGEPSPTGNPEDELAARSLLPSARQLRGTATVIA